MASNKTRRGRINALAAGIIITFALVPGLCAQQFMWTGGGAPSVNWSNGANWQGGIAPAGGVVTTTQLIFAGTTNTGTDLVPLNQNINASLDLLTLTFSPGAGSFFLGGQPVEFDVDPGSVIMQSSSNPQTIRNDITTTTKSANDTTLITLTGDGTGLVTLSGAIQSGNANRDYMIAKTGTSTFALSGANTYGGATVVRGGTLLVNGSTTTSSAVTVNNSGTTLGGAGTIGGTVTLGNTTPGAVLNPGPQGTAGTAAAVGTLTTGALTLTGANIFHADAFGTAAAEWDRLVSTGAISLGTQSSFELTIAGGLTFADGTRYTLLSGTSLDGTFSGIADGQSVAFSGYNFVADYTATGFDLIAAPAPEPATWIGAALAVAAVGFAQRKRLRCSRDR